MTFKRVVFVADYFVENYLGGSEKSLDAIIRVAPSGLHIVKVLSEVFNPGEFQPKKDFIVLGNYNRVPIQFLEDVSARFKFAVIESDFKICRYRLPEMHNVGSEKCECATDPRQEYVRNLFRKSKVNFFKSQRHMDRHLSMLPFLKEHRNVVLSVTYTPEDLAFLLKLRYERKPFSKTFPWDKPVYGIYDSDNWIKGKTDAIEYCKKNDLKYVLIREDDDVSFQRKLATCHGFVFMPRGMESASRITVEAKIIGLDLRINENASVGGDAFMSGTIQEIISFLKERPKLFWEEIDR
mgnify:CR=1 FL=1